MEQVEPQRGRMAAIYARVSSERQREEGTIASQLAGLRELACQHGLIVDEEHWTLIPVPALVSDEQFDLAQARLV